MAAQPPSAASTLKDSDDYSDLTPNENRQFAPAKPERELPTIEFYATTGPHGCFSNFSRHPITIRGTLWPTSEHYFQAQKFAGTRHEEEIRQMASPMDAANAGRDRSRPLRKDWERVKEDIMREALLAKFTQHESCLRTLLRTGDAKLVEATAKDSYWANGGDGSGKNRLGALLMELRELAKKMPECSRVWAEVAQQLDEEEGDEEDEDEDMDEAGSKAHKPANRTRRRKLRQRINLYVDKDGSSKLESNNDKAGTVSVVGSGGVTVSKKALPAAAQMAVYKNQFRRKHQPNEEDFEEQDEDDEDTPNAKPYPRHGGAKLGSFIPSAPAPGPALANDHLLSPDTCIAATRTTLELISDMTKNNAAKSQIQSLADDLRAKKAALEEFLAAEQPEQTLAEILSCIEAANDALARLV